MNGIRHLGPESVQDTAYEVLQNPHPCLVGFGLAGDELHFPPNLFVKTFDMLKEANFPITVHAGEWDGPENIRNAINLLHPTRLGHGVRSIEDPELVKEIIDKGVTAKGSFYFHFPSKEKMVSQLVNQMGERLIQKVDDSIQSQPTPLHRVSLGINTLISTFSKQQKIARILLLNVMGHGITTDKLFLPTWNRFSQLRFQ